jgi:transposase
MDTKIRHIIMDLGKDKSVKRKKYSKEFKLDTIAANEAGDKSMAQMERELEIAEGLLHRWLMELQEVGDEAEVFPGNGNPLFGVEHTEQREQLKPLLQYK